MIKPNGFSFPLISKGEFFMEKNHYNLYYILKEDQQNNAIPPPRVLQILQAILSQWEKHQMVDIDK